MSDEPTTTAHYTFPELVAQSQRDGFMGVRGEQRMQLYEEAVRRVHPTILELGTARGGSTTVFLQACEETDGSLVSVDIEDCSSISDSSHWIFVQSDSTNARRILKQVPLLHDGIDVMFVDSLHRWEHVQAELDAWWPYMKREGIVFFDDVDAAPYRKGQRKDHFSAERNSDLIHQFVRAFFYANMETTRLSISYGSTGLARLVKLSPQGTPYKSVDWRTVIPRRDVLGLRYKFDRWRK